MEDIVKEVEDQLRDETPAESISYAWFLLSDFIQPWLKPVAARALVHGTRAIVGKNRENQSAMGSVYKVAGIPTLDDADRAIFG